MKWGRKAVLFIRAQFSWQPVVWRENKKKFSVLEDEYRLLRLVAFNHSAGTVFFWGRCSVTHKLCFVESLPCRHYPWCSIYYRPLQLHSGAGSIRPVAVAAYEAATSRMSFLFIILEQIISAATIFCQFRRKNETMVHQEMVEKFWQEGTALEGLSGFCGTFSACGDYALQTPDLDREELVSCLWGGLWQTQIWSYSGSWQESRIRENTGGNHSPGINLPQLEDLLLCWREK